MTSLLIVLDLMFTSGSDLNFNHLNAMEALQNQLELVHASTGEAEVEGSQF